MRWIDVAGPPGAGKSTLCDPLWGPHDIQFSDTLPPAPWQDFSNEVTRLFGLLKDHPSFVATVRMHRRSFRKMTSVFYDEREEAYVQTGFVQRGLGLGWRMVDAGIDLNELRHFFRLMPVSIGVAFCQVDPEIVKQRNADREKVKETAHENRAFMVELMEPAINVAREELDKRCVPTWAIDTSDPEQTEKCRGVLRGLALREACHPQETRPCGEVPVLSPPVWW